MKIAAAGRFVSLVTYWTSLFLLIPVAWSVSAGDGGLLPLSFSFLSGMAASLILRVSTRKASLADMGARESILAVTCSWVSAALIGALPYSFGGYAATYLDAFFEAISGFTTTGASVLPDLAAIPESILLWRSLTQWMGGMGIIVLMLAVFRIPGAVMNLYKLEMPGPVHEKFTPRVQGTAAFLWKSYLFLTVAQIACLGAAGLKLFDSVTLALSTIATGGFSPYKESVGHFNSNAVTWITAVFLFLSGANFTLYYEILVRKSLGPLAEDEEFRFYTLLMLAAGVLLSVSLFVGGISDTPGECVSQGFFQAVSMLSTCGFFTSDYSAWPAQAQGIILLLMFCGGCAASSAGGITCIRILVILRHVREEFLRMLHPRAVAPVSIGGKLSAPWVVSTCFAFFTAYLAAFAFGVVASTLMGQDIITALFGVASTLGNVGPGFGVVGPAGSYFAQPPALKTAYILLMLCGRLEIFTLLVLLSPRFWRK